MKIREKPVQKTFKMNSAKKPKKKILKKSKTKVDISKMSVDDFMSGGFDDIDDVNSDSSVKRENKFRGNIKERKQMGKGIKDSKASVKGKMSKKEGMKKLKSKEVGSVIEPGDSDADESEEGGDENIVEKHKMQLDSLKKNDPEFYKYLKENDETLLNFDETDSDDEREDEEECHTAPDELEVASDESDFEPEEGGLPLRKSSRVITMAMIKSWQKKLPTTKNKKVLKDVIDAFHASVLRVSTGDDGVFRYKVDGSSVFNAVIRMCVMDLHSGIRNFLRLEEGSNTPPTQCKFWAKIKAMLKVYFEDLTQLAGVTSPSMLTVLLKHVHQMIPFLIYFSNIAQRTLRRLIILWSTSEETVRVLAFLCLLRLTNKNHSFLNNVLKKMYLAYVKNTKFVSPNTLAEVNFMRQSLSEMFALDDTISYQMAFIYIRQLAVHLRNAITLKKKENIQTVYSWQYISSLQLWAEVFGLVPNGSPLRTLLYPIVQIIIGTIKLIPSPQYYPLRFHCCRILINLSSKCGVFIPVLPFLLEVLQEFDFNREHKKLSMKPMDLTCLLRCTKLQMKENAFKDALMENTNNLLIEYIAIECHRISFPDVFVPVVLQLKQFVKNCKVLNYTKMMKAILEKINENSKFIESERKKMNFRLNDTETVEAIEAGIRVKGTPFSNYYENWKKIYMQQQMRKVVDQVKVNDFNLPVLYKLDKKRSRQQSRSDGQPELFPSDDEEEVNLGPGEESNSEEEDGEEKKKRKLEKKSPSKLTGAKKMKKSKREVASDDGGAEDIVENFKLSDDEE